MNKASRLAKNAVLSHDVSTLMEAFSLVKSFSGIRIEDDYDYYTVMEYAVLYENVEAIRIIFEHYGSDALKGSELIIAVGLGSIEIVDLLLSWHDDVNRVGYSDFTPLIMAAQEGKTEVAKHLLAAGADKWLYAGYDDGQSPLYVAASEGNNEIVKLLLDDIPDEQREKVNDAFIMAGIWNNFEAVELMLHAGADINGVDSDGRTLLFYALVYGKKELTDFLLNNGASLDIADKCGISIRHLFEDPAFLRKISLRVKRGVL